MSETSGGNDDHTGFEALVQRTPTEAAHGIAREILSQFGELALAEVGKWQGSHKESSTHIGFINSPFFRRDYGDQEGEAIYRLSNAGWVEDDIMSALDDDNVVMYEGDTEGNINKVMVISTTSITTYHQDGITIEDPFYFLELLDDMLHALEEALDPSTPWELDSFPLDIIKFGRHATADYPTPDVSTLSIN